MDGQDMGDLLDGGDEGLTDAAIRIARFAAEHRLTPAETQILALVLQGLAAKEIARARNASEHTVRTQLKAILHKTGTHSQRQLVARVGAA
jgi:DNA-binding CsgD family transcriptional regulator